MKKKWYSRSVWGHINSWGHATRFDTRICSTKRRETRKDCEDSSEVVALHFDAAQLQRLSASRIKVVNSSIKPKSARNIKSETHQWFDHFCARSPHSFSNVPLPSSFLPSVGSAVDIDVSLFPFRCFHFALSYVNGKRSVQFTAQRTDFLPFHSICIRSSFILMMLAVFLF